MKNLIQFIILDLKKLKREYLKRKRRHENLFYYVSVIIFIISIILIMCCFSNLFAQDRIDINYINDLFNEHTSIDQNWSKFIKNENDIIFYLNKFNKSNLKKSYIWKNNKTEYPEPIIFDTYILTKNNLIYYNSDKKVIKSFSTRIIDFLMHEYNYVYKDKTYLYRQEILIGESCKEKGKYENDKNSNFNNSKFF